MHANQSPDEPVIQMRRQQFGGSFGFEVAQLNPATVAEVLDYLFNTKKWTQDVSILRRHVSNWRLTLFKDSAEKNVSRGATQFTVTPLFPPPSGPSTRTIPRTEQDMIVVTVAHTPSENDPPGDEVDPDDVWIEEAVAMKIAGVGWKTIIDKVQRPRTTVRRVVSRTLEARGIKVTG